MQEQSRPSRRTVISAGAVAALGAGALAACGSDQPTPVAVDATNEVPSDTPSTPAGESATAPASSSAASPTTAPAAAAKPTTKPTTRPTTKTTGATSEDDETTETSSTTKTTSQTTKTTTKTTKPPQPVDAKLSEIPVGGAVVKTIKGRKVVLSQPRSGSVVAFDAACTHAGCPVQPAGGRLNCNCHGSAFDTSSGAVLNGPATRGLAKIGVTVHDGGVSLA